MIVHLSPFDKFILCGRVLGRKGVIYIILIFGKDQKTVPSSVNPFKFLRQQLRGGIKLQGYDFQPSDKGDRRCLSLKLDGVLCQPTLDRQKDVLEAFCAGRN